MSALAPSRRTAARLAAGLFVAALAAGCGTAGVRPAAGLEAEVRELRQRIAEMQRQAAINQLAIDELRAQVASLEAALGMRRGAAATPAPVRPPAARQPTGATTRPSAPAPRQSAPAPAPDDDLEAEDFDAPAVPVTRRPTPTEAAPRTAPPPPAVPISAAPAAASPSSASIPPAGQALYDRGYTLYHQGLYVDAEASFQRFLHAHGDTDLADNAQYWIGESRFARGDHRGALAAFQETAARYPQGNKVPDALLKAGQSLEHLGDPEGARAAYRTVVERFSSSAAAVAAEERLARLR